MNKQHKALYKKLMGAKQGEYKNHILKNTYAIVASALAHDNNYEEIAKLTEKMAELVKTEKSKVPVKTEKSKPKTEKPKPKTEKSVPANDIRERLKQRLKEQGGLI